MITGVYLPEINGAVRQCSQLIISLKELVKFSVLTGTNDSSMQESDNIDSVSISRFFMPKKHKLKYALSIGKFFLCLISLLRKTDIVHVHGFSKRNAAVVFVSLLLRKRVIIKMTSYGHDDPISIKNSSLVLWNIFKYCHAYIGISPAFMLSYKKSGLLDCKYNNIPNCVDLDRYSPISTSEKKVLKLKYGFSEHDKLIVFVGHFSPEKRPELLYKAWVRLRLENLYAKLIFIGHTKSHFEVDEGIAESIRQDGFQRGILSQIYFIEQTPNVDEYMKMADIFVLPSIREGLPNVLLEAMACSLPCIVRDIAGVTDWLIEDGVTGVLFRSDDHNVLADKMAPFFLTTGNNEKIGIAARYFVKSNFSCKSNSQAVFDLYMKNMGAKSRVLGLVSPEDV